MALMSVGGCLELNPDFVDDHGSGSAAGTESASGDGDSSGGDSSGDSTGDVSGDSTSAAGCPVDPFEPNPAEEPADVANGTLSAVLAPSDDEDWFKTFIDPGGPSEILARASSPDVRACLFVECDGGAATMVTKCNDTLSTDAFGRPGCCGGPTASLEYDCGGTFGIVVHVRVDDAPAECEPYDLEIGAVGG